jgi:hypothetical protein
MLSSAHAGLACTSPTWGSRSLATRLFSDDQLEQLEQLRSFPDIGKDDLIRFSTLAPADVAFVDPGRRRGRRCRGWRSACAWIRAWSP